MELFSIYTAVSLLIIFISIFFITYLLSKISNKKIEKINSVLIILNDYISNDINKLLITDDNNNKLFSRNINDDEENSILNLLKSDALVDSYKNNDESQKIIITTKSINNKKHKIILINK